MIDNTSKYFKSIVEASHEIENAITYITFAFQHEEITANQKNRSINKLTTINNKIADLIRDGVERKY